MLSFKSAFSLSSFTFKCVLICVNEEMCSCEIWVCLLYELCEWVNVCIGGLKICVFTCVWELRMLVSVNGTPLQHSCLENPMNGGAWWAAVHGVDEGQTQLSDFTFTFHFHALEKEMATYSSVLTWRIPGTVEPGGLPSLGSQNGTGLRWLSSLAAVSVNVWIYAYEHKFVLVNL